MITQRNHKHGFTLIELLITVSIIGILTSVAIPKMGNLVRKARESATLGNLGALRSALNIYYGDTGFYPSEETDNLRGLTTGAKYINQIPSSDTFPYHPATNSVHTCNDPIAIGNDGFAGWVYGYLPDNHYGEIYVSCWHKTLAGKEWYKY